MPLATALVVWQPQVWFRFMPCQIARIPVSHSLLAGKGQLSLSWASLIFAVFVGTRWFGCYNTLEELYENMTAAEMGAVHHVWFSSFFLSAGCVSTFLLERVSVHSSEHQEIPDLPCFTLSFCLASVLVSLTLCRTAASLNRQEFVWKVIGALWVSGCQLDKALHIIKSNNCLRVLWAVWNKRGLLVFLYDLCYLETSSKICGSAVTYSDLCLSIIES